MSIYLFQIGYSVSQIGFFWAAFYIFKACISLLCARIIAKIGPKHATLMANISYIPAVVAFALLPQYGDWLLPVIIVFQGFSITLYTIAYNVDFSKVKNAEHAGKEIALVSRNFEPLSSARWVCPVQMKFGNGSPACAKSSMTSAAKPADDEVQGLPPARP